MTKARSNATAEAAKGDLRVGNGTNLSGILAVGNNGETIVADSSTATGLRWTNRVGSNCVINGAFDYWQRGTSFSIGAYQPDVWSADRWQGYAGAGTATITRQSITAGEIVSDWSPYYLQYQQTGSAGGVGVPTVYTKVEDVRTLAGQTATFSFWAKANAAATVSLSVSQVFGSGGSTTAGVGVGSFAVTTSWARYSVAMTVPSITGKTLGTNSYLQISLQMPTSGTYTIGFANVQMELGHVASTFTRAGGTIQGELAACQRYYYRQTALAGTAYTRFTGFSPADSTTLIGLVIQNPVQMRVAPTSVDYGSLTLYGGAFGTFTSLAIAGENNSLVSMVNVTGSGLTQYRPYALIANASASAYLGFSAEL